MFVMIFLFSLGFRAALLPSVGARLGIDLSGKSMEIPEINGNSWGIFQQASYRLPEAKKWLYIPF